MAINIEEHELVPEHEVMEEDEVEELLDEYEISKDQLPEMERNDPMAKRIDAEVGDVVRITRASPTAGETEYFRVVVE